MGKKGPSYEQKEQMVDDYLSGCSAREASGRYGFSKIVCEKALKEFGYKARATFKHLPPEIENKIIELYKESNFVEKIGEMLGISGSTVSNVLKRNNIHMKTSGEQQRKYYVNESAFTFPPVTEEQFYWLGFLLADATVQKGWFNIKLQAQDEGHLIKFRDFIGSDQRITRGEGERRGKIHPYCRIQINSAKIVNDLKEYGIIENKMYISYVVEALKRNRHFWRGLIDGDGSLFKRSMGGWSLALTGSKDVVESFREFVSFFTDSCPKINCADRTYSVYYGGTALVKPLADLFYTNSIIHLDRKKNLANILKEEQCRKSKLEINYALIEEYKKQ